MSKPVIAVFTAWPDRVKDQYNHFEVVVKESCQQLIHNTFASQDVKANLQRYVAWAHDRKWYKTFDFCLYVSTPIGIELSDFLLHLDSNHTTYMDTDGDVILYQPGSIWQAKIINIEKSPISPGVIFIDCWQQIMDQSQWSNCAKDFDFYLTMKQTLLKYSPSRLVFHTGQYGNLPLAEQLRSWQSSTESCDILDTKIFQQHYQQTAVTDWIVVGAHWQRCTHDKPLGFHRLSELKLQDPKLRIYSHQDCTIKFLNDDIEQPIVTTLDSQDYDQDSLIWKPNGKLFELVIE